MAKEASGDEGVTHRRLRHITAISVRNLSPYPARDVFASALNQPTEQSHLTTDDLDLTWLRDSNSNLAKKRSRRVSTHSNKTLRSLRSDEGVGVGELSDIGERQQRTARSRTTSFPASVGEASLGLSRSPARPPTIRPVNRKRTSSMNSAFFLPPVTPEAPLADPSAPPASWSYMLPDNSQANLEKVMNSRLVETFLAITVPSTDPSVSPSQPGTPTSDHSLRIRPTTPPQSAPHTREKFTPSHQKNAASTSSARRGTIYLKLPSTPTSPASTKSGLSPRRDTLASPRIASAKASAVHARSSSVSSPRPHGNGLITRVSSKPTTPTISSPSTPSPTPSALVSPEPTIPNYLSSIHRPSTNPLFAIDATAGADFADWTDLSGDKMRVEVWGKVGNAWHGSTKGKERVDADTEWNVLEAWEIDLADLMPLPDDLLGHSSKLPPNTLLVTLSPPGQTYYVPPPPVPTPPSLEAINSGYNSDPELDSRKDRQVGDLVLSAAAPPGFLETEPPNAGASIAVLGKHRTRSHRNTGTAKTASWQDLLKLVTLQACVVDTDGSLSDIMREIDRILAADTTSALKREASERESRLRCLGDDLETVEERSRELRLRIEKRREGLRERREMLGHARLQHKEESALELLREQEVISERDKLATLRTHFTPIRTSLMTVLSTIYPIDLLSPPDLLFTILDVPLPIPLTSADPAPPLSLPMHKEVTEDAVATALGYVAQAVQLLAAYLGKGLVYPVTCVGSRSLIRDGISAMVGPRMFPLFSKGVDTYRFEYGVFLLNKDIELLMADRDLRALDMRHTLPNLKNLLLTLADGDGVIVPTRIRTSRGVSQLPTRSESEIGLGAPSLRVEELLLTAPGEQTAGEEEVADGHASGSTTPTAAKSVSKSSFLGLSPLAGFLRARYPSVSASPPPAPKPAVVAEDVGEDEEEREDEEEEDEDRRTIREVDVQPSSGTEKLQLPDAATTTAGVPRLVAHVG